MRRRGARRPAEHPRLLFSCERVQTRRDQNQNQNTSKTVRRPASLCEQHAAVQITLDPHRSILDTDRSAAAARALTRSTDYFPAGRATIIHRSEPGGSLHGVYRRTSKTVRARLQELKLPRTFIFSQSEPDQSRSRTQSPAPVSPCASPGESGWSLRLLQNRGPLYVTVTEQELRAPQLPAAGPGLVPLLVPLLVPDWSRNDPGLSGAALEVHVPQQDRVSGSLLPRSPDPPLCSRTQTFRGSPPSLRCCRPSSTEPN